MLGFAPLYPTYLADSSKRKKARLFRIGLSLIWSLAMTYFHIAAATLSSALFRFTTEFGMGSGGSKTLLSPSKFGLIRSSEQINKSGNLISSKCLL